MKNIRQKVICALLAVLTVINIAPSLGRASAAASNERIIYNFFRNEMGANTAVACGVLANIERESGFKPVTDGVIDTNVLQSFGICQWNGERFKALNDFCAERGLDITSIYAQLKFLKFELETSESYAWGQVKKQPDTAEGAYQAGFNWARYFERCNSVYRVPRAELARDKYWPKYSGNTEEAEPEDPDEDTSGKLTESVKSGWVKEDGKWYFYSEAGVKIVGRHQIDGKWYYMDKNGVMQTGWQLIKDKWYYYNKDGALQAGWRKLGGKWYYLDENGAMLTGFQTIKGVTYCLNDSGAMLTGWQKLDGRWYRFSSSGAMTTGWCKSGGRWYYLNSSGVMVTGWANIKGVWYFFDRSGAMLTGWQKIKDYWYYLGEDGAMASDAWIGSWYVDKDGRWTKSA